MFDIDWKADDGVFLPMLNDFRRNRCYESLLSMRVADRECVDIGFGTGLLSMIALKHGAKHITAYESDHKRYQLGQHIIQQLGLGQRISLTNEKFDYTQYQSHKVYFSEIMNSGLWGEGLFNVMPRQRNIEFWPGQYFFELHAMSIPDSFADRLFQADTQHSFFCPGIDIDPEFVDLVNQLMSAQPSTAQKIFQDYDYHNSTIWGGWSFLKAVQFDSQPAACYTVDCAKQLLYLHDSNSDAISALDFSAQAIDIQVDISSTTTLLVPRVGFECNGKKFCLDTAESWGPAYRPTVVRNKTKVIAHHCLKSGLITYSL